MVEILSTNLCTTGWNRQQREYISNEYNFCWSFHFHWVSKSLNFLCFIMITEYRQTRKRAESTIQWHFWVWREQMKIRQTIILKHHMTRALTVGFPLIPQVDVTTSYDHPVPSLPSLVLSAVILTQSHSGLRTQSLFPWKMILTVIALSVDEWLGNSLRPYSIRRDRRSLSAKTPRHAFHRGVCVVPHVAGGGANGGVSNFFGQCPRFFVCWLLCARSLR